MRRTRHSRLNAEATIVREVRDPNDPAILAFGEMQQAAYFAPEMLIPAAYIPHMLTARDETTPRRNHLVVAALNGRVVGGALFHWLGSVAVGFSSFMGVDRAFRGRGIGRRLHEERLRILDRDAGSAAGAKGVFIDVVNPTRLSDAELGRERAAGSDPWVRRQVFEHLGFRQIDIRYEQPVGGPGGGPVTTMDLLFCPREPVDSIPTQLVVAVMRAYWSSWLGDARAASYAEELRARAHGASRLELISPVPKPPGPDDRSY